MEKQYFEVNVHTKRKMSKKTKKKEKLRLLGGMALIIALTIVMSFALNTSNRESVSHAAYHVQFHMVDEAKTYFNKEVKVTSKPVIKQENSNASVTASNSAICITQPVPHYGDTNIEKTNEFTKRLSTRITKLQENEVKENEAKKYAEYNKEYQAYLEQVKEEERRKKLENKRRLAKLAKQQRYILKTGELQIFQNIVEAEVTGSGNPGLSRDAYIRCKVRVAQVILNRVDSKRFPDTVRGVVMSPGQFAPLTDGRYGTLPITKETKEAIQIALSKATPDYTDHCTYFSSDHFGSWAVPHFTDPCGHTFYTSRR